MSAGAVHIRPYERGDEVAAVRIFERAYPSFIGPCKKESGRWIARRSKTLEADPESILIAENEAGVVGYATYFKKWEHLPICCDLCVQPNSSRGVVASLLLSRLEERLSFKGLVDAKFPVSPRDKFVYEALAKRGYSIAPWNQVFMASVIDLPSLLTELQPLLTSRVARSKHASWSGVVRLQSPTQKADVKIEDGVVSIEKPGRRRVNVEVRTTDDALTTILMGCLSIWQAYLQLWLSSKSRMSEEVRSLLETLFPPIPWFLPVEDWW